MVPGTSAGLDRERSGWYRIKTRTKIIYDPSLPAEPQSMTKTNEIQAMRPDPGLEDRSMDSRRIDSPLRMRFDSSGIESTSYCRKSIARTNKGAQSRPRISQALDIGPWTKTAF
jgi:hypothetical protein